MIRNLLLLFFFLVILKTNCFSHGVEYKIIKGGIGLEIKYSDGSPFSYSEVKIFSPKDKKVCFQTGITDGCGRFLFYPDVSGVWKIEANDGMGHGVVKEIFVSDDLTVKEETKSESNKFYKLITGLAIIWGVTGTIFYIIAKRKIKNAYT